MRVRANESMYMMTSKKDVNDRNSTPLPISLNTLNFGSKLQFNHRFQILENSEDRIQNRHYYQEQIY